ncbi:MAG TPA: hypothetical protein VLO13_07695 [Halomonas sp.]|nr:hypothetical protein [Halomonas sp.]
MKLTLPRGQQWFAVIVIAIFVLYLGNRLWTHRDITWLWKEEVQLADGTRLWVERVEVREVKGGGEPFTGITRGTKTTQIRFPDNQGEVVWEATLAAMILERGEPPARWTVIASPVWCEEHYQYGSPKPPYIQFDYVNGQWTHKHVDPKWYGRKANLSMDEEQHATGKVLPVDQVRKFNDPVYKISKRYLSVDGNYKSNCY